MDLKKRLWPHVTSEQWSDYKWQLANRLTSAKDLEQLLGIKGNAIEPCLDCLGHYKWASTPYYISLIEEDYSTDPIALQIIPSHKEIEFKSPLSSPDPLSEHVHSPLPGLIHRYRDRVVVLASSICSSYCRHCNRKRTWKRPESIPATDSAWGRVCSYLRSHPEVREVLVSGGDPLLLPLHVLEQILKRLSSLPNIKVLRIGTRLPVVLPMAITEGICSLLKRYRPIWLNTQFNHPREITAEARQACERLQLAGIPVSNQCVLLKGVNDDFDTMKDLCCNLQAIMVRPYYLFHCDFVAGTDHFRTTIKKGVDIIEKMWGHVGGMCIPNYVIDLPEGLGKARLMPAHLKGIEDGFSTFQTFEGHIVRLEIT